MHELLNLFLTQPLGNGGGGLFLKARVSLAFISISCQQKLGVHIKAFSCQNHLSSAVAASRGHAQLGSWRGVATGNEEGHTGGGGQGISSKGLKVFEIPWQVP